MKGADESLDGFTLNVACQRISLCLNVDLFQSERVLVDDSIDSTISSPADATTALLGSAVSHREEQRDDRFLEEIRMAVPEAFE